MSPALLVLTFQLLAQAPRADAPQASPSVYEVSWPVDGSVIAATALGIAVPYALSRELIHPRCPCSPNELNALDRSVLGNNARVPDVVSDITVGLAWVAPVVGDAFDVGFDRTLLEDMTVYVEALTVNGALATLAKYTVQRPLPVVYSLQEPKLVSSPGGYRSFYSGHTSNAVAALTAASLTYELRHGPSVWPWLVTGVVGLSVAAERVAAGRHFYTDVAMGAAMGFVSGYFVPLLHTKRFWNGGLSFQPVAGGAALVFTRPL